VVRKVAGVLDAADWARLRQLQAEVDCPRRFACVESALTDLCEGKYHQELDILECLEETQPACRFARPFGGTRVCLCPLRKLIAQNFERWSAQSTQVLRKRQP